MDRKGRIIVLVISLIVLIAFSIFLIFNSKYESEYAMRMNEKIQNYYSLVEEQQRIQLEKEKRTAEIKEMIPGIACWGDDLTYGLGGMKNSYPSVLNNELILAGYDIEVKNLGVYGEDSLTVLGRANAIPFVIKEDCEIYANKYSELEIMSRTGEAVQPLLRSVNPGVNPVLINGIRGMLGGTVSSGTSESVNEYLFAPLELKDSTTVSAGTEIVTAGVEFVDYISILSIGENGGWGDDPSTLLSQQRSFVETRGLNKDKTIIIGLIKGNTITNNIADTIMSDAFGKNFINIREYLCNEGINKSNIELSEEDKIAVNIGEVPKVFYNDRGLNDEAYKLIGELLFEKLEELGYILK